MLRISSIHVRSLRSVIAIFLLVSMFMMVATVTQPISASAAHWYWKEQTGEKEFKRIPKTIESSITTNALIETVFESSTEKGVLVGIYCHAIGRDTLYTTGEGLVTELTFSSCGVKNDAECIVRAEGPPQKEGGVKQPSILTESGKPVSYGNLYKNVIIFYEVTVCNKKGIYSIFKGEVEGAFYQAINNVEFEFPYTPLKGTHLEKAELFGRKIVTFTGRYRLAPLLGAALSVGP